MTRYKFTAIFLALLGLIAIASYIVARSFIISGGDGPVTLPTANDPFLPPKTQPAFPPFPSDPVSTPAGEVQSHPVEDAQDPAVTAILAGNGFQGVPTALQKLAKLMPTNSTVVLEDGSTWVGTFKSDAIASWLVGDQVMILPNPVFTSPLHYLVLNQGRQAVVAVNLLSGPEAGKLKTIQSITRPDKVTGYAKIALQDGTKWEISTYKQEVIADWKTGQGIIVGANDDVDAQTFPYVLINVESSRYIGARQQSNKW